VQPDAHVYWAALGLALVSGLLFGLAPLRQIQRTDPYQTIKAGSIGGVGRRITARDLLLGAQIAICAVLVTSSLVAARGMARSLNSNFGFEPRNALLLNTNLAMGGYQGEAAAAMQQRMAEEAAAIPGVTAVGWIDRVPLTGNTISTSVYTDDTGEPTPSSAVASPLMYSISTDYLRAAGTALLAGRSFTQHDAKLSAAGGDRRTRASRRRYSARKATRWAVFRRRSGPRFEVVGLWRRGSTKA
jgi:hypothetical protein